ncbi:AI-2E family transporter [Novosphingobium album (ex Liu et al. 2023)]|uniref:AI-2E family transporter n=1 Tax=Novosphingobium album (ex Liu et al. 2023) TaxID=3031130 RepID=A0ABT5WS53_9SPHN|nr:AI-2E family transporter [Novosphingobium album (ex Liu et al. 2023)]MDE8652679.1 AI-2E family transporter [Novosphingobium album (ex Liu et al. 2023)]
MTGNHLRGLRLEDGGFLAVVLIVTLAFGWLIAPFFGAILWALVTAILFEPPTRKLAARLGGRHNVAAALMLLLILTLAIVPALLLGISLVQEAASLYVQINEGHIDFGTIFEQLRDALPRRLSELVDTYGLADIETLRRLFGGGVANGLQEIAARALVFGQGALSFLAALGVMLYLSFFLLRDGQRMGEFIKAAVPLRPELRDALIGHFIVVVRATMKGTVVVALMQGLVGGVIFWLLGIEGALLWGVLMGFFSLLPAVGTGIIWVPVAIYLFATGSFWQGAVLTGCGFFVIGLIDNLLRPILVGRDTRMPDFVVLIATLSGLQLFGLNGFIVGPVIASLFIAVWKMVAELRSPALPAESAATSDRTGSSGS